MQFKTLAFLSILSILFFTGCDSKENTEDVNETKVEKVYGVGYPGFMVNEVLEKLSENINDNEKNIVII